MKNCPYCKDSLNYLYNKEDVQVNYIGNLIPMFELKYGRLLLCPDCENYWYEDQEPYRYYRLLLKQNLQRTLDWNVSLPIASEEQKAILKQIKAHSQDSYGTNSGFIDFPVSCYHEDNWIDFCIVRFQKLPPFLVMFKYSMDFLRLDAIKDIRPSEYALPAVIRSFSDVMYELGLGDHPLLTSAPNQEYYGVWVMQDFFFSDGVKGRDLKLESFLTSRIGKSINYEQSSLPIKYVVADWDEEMNKYRA